MDLIDRLREIALRVPSHLEHLHTEEATKNALVLPFINSLGYNVFDPTEVVPEFTADVGTKKGEKVDYAVLKDGQPVMLFECKASNCSLDEAHASQLYRYFSVTPAHFGVLTNGVQYRFFSDLEEPNKMDSRPFFEFSILSVDEKTAEELKKFAKQSFDLEKILSTASDLKYTKGIKRLLAEELTNPSEDFVRLFTGRVYLGRLTQSVKEQFTGIVKRAFQEFLNERINDRLQSALERSSAAEAEEEGLTEDLTSSDEGRNRAIVTTEEELEGFYMVKAILGNTIDVRRVFIRDTRRYCGILLDDTNRKPICRLWFNATPKCLGLFDENKNETQHAIQDTNDIYKFSEHLRQTVQYYDDIRSQGQEIGS
jgi:hypothetical protein